ncbi:hypothetical protein NPIL_691891 [Nephila pilipes]|uniref:Uncharacterized protein n=1 Tax=Nephila pilipes TaxID=299642 RepID=A0A8X6NYC0_NEPPI|nr:hypothetical protein NPIL_691891 [Nephila pilipes]
MLTNITKKRAKAPQNKSQTERSDLQFVTIPRKRIHEPKEQAREETYEVFQECLSQRDRKTARKTVCVCVRTHPHSFTHACTQTHISKGMSGPNVPVD